MKFSYCSLFAALSATTSAYVKVHDPSDYVDVSADASDNAIKANYTLNPTFYQLGDIIGTYQFNHENHKISHLTLSVHANDTSVVVAANGSAIVLDHTTIIKQGYASSLFQSSFFGTNAAINIANASTALISNSNITVHNGAANIYAYGTNTIVNVTNTDLYSSGPVSHGLYASGNATIYGNNIRHYSGGNRCSSFSGDSPAGYIYVRDSIAHTTGIGSAIFYALGEIHANNIFGWAERAPVLFSDGPQKSSLENVDLQSDFLAGTVVFSSMKKVSGAVLRFANSRLKVTGKEQSALWFGNIIAKAEIFDTEIQTVSNVLVVANRSQVTQEFSFFAGSEENPEIAGAEVDITVSGSTLKGDLIALNGSTIDWNLGNFSTWTGAAVGKGGGNVSVSLDKASKWILTADTVLANLTNEDPEGKNIQRNGFKISLGR